MKKSILICGVLYILFFSFLLRQEVKATSYPDGTVFKSPQHSSVYQIMDGKRRSFYNLAVYNTWYNNFNNVKVISTVEMESIELGNPMPIKPNTKLLKFPLNPKVYAITNIAETIQHIPDEQTAIALYGNDWAKNVIEMPEIYWLFYAKGSALEKKVVANPIVIPKANSGKQYSTQTVEPKLMSNATILEDMTKMKHINKSDLNENGQLVIREVMSSPSYYYKGKLYKILYEAFDDWYQDNMSMSILNGKDYDSIGENIKNYVCGRAGDLIRYYVEGTASAKNSWKGEYSNIYYVANNCVVHKVPSEAWVKKWYGVYTDKENDLEPTKFTVEYVNSLYFSSHYTVGTPFVESSSPVGATVKDDNGDIWFIDTDGKRLVTEEGIKNNNFFTHLLLNKLDLPISKKPSITSGEFFLPNMGLKNK